MPGDLAWVLEALPEAVVVVDPDGRVEHVNGRARGVLGLDRSCLGQLLVDVLDLRDDAGRRCVPVPPGPAVGDRLAERVLRVHDRDRVRPVAVAGTWHDGRLVLTARSAARRERLDAVHGDVVATVSHEIRSPLTSVKGFTRTLLDRWDRFSDEQRRMMLETIDADADRVTRLLKDLLDVSRIDAGRVEVHRSRVDVRALAHRVVARLWTGADAEGREIAVHVPDDLPDVLVDADKLEQVLINLVDNARSHAQHGPVTVGVDLVDGLLLRVVVADEGPGIPADQHRLVFQKFGRGREVRRAGSGLGLYIIRGLAEAHGGRVQLVSPAGGGARFEVDLAVVPVIVP